MTSKRLGRRSVSLGIAVAVVALALPFVQVASANHGNRTLEVEPETLDRPINQIHVFTATLDSQATTGTGAINVDFEQETGPNDPDGAPEDSPEFPDLSCSIPAGQTQCTAQYIGEEPGLARWRSWIDHDGLNETVEADLDEARNEDAMSGGNPGTGDACNIVEPDCTDVVTVNWQGVRFPAFIDCDDEQGPDTERSKSPSGGGNASNEGATCKIFDQNRQPITDADPNTGGSQSTTLYGENEGGANDPDNGVSYDTPDYTCNTPTSGGGSNQCTMQVAQGELELGFAEACFWAVGRHDGTPQAAGTNHCADEPTGESQQQTGADPENDLADQTEVTWEERRAAGLDIEADTSSHVVEEDRELTATVYDQFEQPFQGDTQVNFEFFAGSPKDSVSAAGTGNDPANPDETCTTSNAPTCTETYTSQQAGRDLICAWIGDAPGMSGNNRNDKGKCGGEDRKDGDDAEGDADAPQPIDDRIDLASTVWKNDPEATVLECTPEKKKRRPHKRHRLTCTATTTEPDSGVANTEIDIEAAGANDPDNGNSRNNPDFTCTTNADGKCTVQHGGGKATRQKGKTIYTAWIDPDYLDSTTESDNDEGRNESKKAGTGEEPDNTDVMKIKWRRRR